MSPRGPSEQQPRSEIEQEVDFGVYLKRLAHGWLVILVAIVIGAVLALALTFGSRNLYRGDVTIYLGQPLAVGSGAQIQSLSTNPSAVTQLIHSNDVLGLVSKRTGLPREKLLAGVSSATVQGSLPKQNQSPLVTISVQAHATKDEVTKAANTLAKVVLARLSAYPRSKVTNINSRIAIDREQIDGINKRMKAFYSAIAAGNGAGAGQILTVQIALAQSDHIAGLNSDIASEQLMLSQIRTVEAGSIVTRADAEKTAGHSLSNALAVGAALGLLIGALFVLTAPRFRRKRTT